MNKTLRFLLSVAITIACITMFESCGKKTDITETTIETSQVVIEETTIPTFVPLQDGCEGVESLDWTEESVDPEKTEKTSEITKSTEPKTTDPKPMEANPTQPMPTEVNPSVTKPSEPTPTEAKPTVTKPTEPKPTEPPVKVGPCCEYDKYLSMSPAEQETYMSTFSNPLEFIQWSQDAEAEHKAHDDTINIEGGDLNIGVFME